MQEESSKSSTTSRSSKNNTTSISECPDSYAKWYCLNGATCFAVKIRDSTLYNCWCPAGFHGLRCDYKYVERRYHQTTDSDLSREGYRQMAIAVQTLSQQKTAENVVPGDATHNQYEAITTSSRQPTKETNLIMYNLLILFLIFILIALILSFFRGKRTPTNIAAAAAVATTTTTATMEQLSLGRSLANQGSQSEREKNGQTNDDSVSIELDMVKQRLHCETDYIVRAHRQHHHYQRYQTHWISLVNADHQRRKPV